MDKAGIVVIMGTAGSLWYSLVNSPFIGHCYPVNCYVYSDLLLVGTVMANDHGNS